MNSKSTEIDSETPKVCNLWESVVDRILPKFERLKRAENIKMEFLHQPQPIEVRLQERMGNRQILREKIERDKDYIRKLDKKIAERKHELFEVVCLILEVAEAGRCEFEEWEIGLREVVDFQDEFYDRTGLDLTHDQEFKLFRFGSDRDPIDEMQSQGEFELS